MLCSLALHLFSVSLLLAAVGAEDIDLDDLVERIRGAKQAGYVRLQRGRGTAHVRKKTTRINEESREVSYRTEEYDAAFAFRGQNTRVEHCSPDIS